MLPVRSLFLAIGTIVCVYASTAQGLADESAEARAKAAALRAEIQAAETTLRAAELALQRALELKKSGAISAAEVERIALDHQRAQALLQAKRAEQAPMVPKATKLLDVAAAVGGFVTEIHIKEGDRVKAGQVLARLDDRKARLEVDRAKAKLVAAEGELQAAEATMRETQSRKKSADDLHARRAITKEDHGLAVLTYDRTVAELATKRALIQLAAVDVRMAQLHLDMHTIASPLSGVVRKIHRAPGEGVRKYGPVVGVQPSE